MSNILKEVRDVLHKEKSWFAMTNRYNNGDGFAGSTCDKILLGRGFHAVRGNAIGMYSPALENIDYKLIDKSAWIIICTWSKIVFGIEYGSKIDGALSAFAEKAADEDSNWVEELND